MINQELPKANERTKTRSVSLVWTVFVEAARFDSVWLISGDADGSSAASLEKVRKLNRGGAHVAQLQRN